MRISRARSAGLAVIVAGIALAGCSSSSAGSGSGGAAGASSSPAAAAATWQPGGTWTGPVPPAIPMPGPRAGLDIPAYTSPDGYKVKESVTFGVPLHYRVPQRMFDCNSSQEYQFDLPPGKFVVPFMISIRNLTGQQAPASLFPTIATTDKDGGFGVQITGASGSGAMWANGACSQEVNHLMPAGGSDAVWGFIGPATAAQLQATYISVVQDAGGASPLTVPLHTVMPHLGASWLIAQGG